jgi:hypothetical protein
VTARFLAGHHQPPRAERVEVGPRLVNEVDLPGGEQTGGEPLANKPSLRKPADRGEAIADHRTSAMNDIGNYGNGVGCQTTGRNRWVRVPRDRNSAVSNLEYRLHRPLAASREPIIDWPPTITSKPWVRDDKPIMMINEFFWATHLDRTRFLIFSPKGRISEWSITRQSPN